MNVVREHSHSAVAGFFIALVLEGAGGCGRRAEAVVPTGQPHPQVTVAEPVVASVAEFSEHTGRTEAPGTVEIRARASGYLLRAAFHEGDVVKKGDLLFLIDPRPYQAVLARAKADLLSARADYELAKKNAARAEQLFKTDAIPERDLDAQRAAVDRLAAHLAAAEAAVSSAALDLDYAYVRSPIAGRIGRMLITPGNIVAPGTPTPLATVVSIDPLYVYIDVDETHGLRLRGAARGLARVGFPGEEGYPHEARIDFIDNRVDPATGTLKVRAVVRNPDGRLSHGLFARVRLTDGVANDVLLISDRAIATDQDRRFVWVVGADGKAKYHAVKLGPLESGLRVVREGLSPSDRVVVRGLQRIRPGAEVTAELISMNAVDRERAPKEVAQ
jgi:RND family efflux transporter MFP subunit